MSAYVVEKSHINGMIKGGLSVSSNRLTWFYNGEHKELTYDNANQVGQLLMDECIKSVSSRYEDTPLTELPGRVDAEYLLPFEYYPLGKIPKPIELISITRCYEYQSCEHDEWETSEAKVICKALVHSAIGRLPGYDDAPWDWHEDIPQARPVRLV